MLCHRTHPDDLYDQTLTLLSNNDVRVFMAPPSALIGTYYKLFDSIKGFSDYLEKTDIKSIQFGGVNYTYGDSWAESTADLQITVYMKVEKE